MPNKLAVTSGVDDNKWRHIAVTFGTNTREPYVFLYVDGVAEEIYAQSINHDNLSIDTGSYPIIQLGGLGFYGLLDDVRIYSVELNPGEIANIYRESLVSGMTTFQHDYTVAAWIKPSRLPDSDLFEFAYGRFFGKIGMAM